MLKATECLRRTVWMSVQARILLHSLLQPFARGEDTTGINCRGNIYRRKLDSQTFNDVFNLAPWCAYRKLSLKSLSYIHGGTYRDIDDNCGKLLTRPTCKCIFSLSRGPIFFIVSISSGVVSLSRARSLRMPLPISLVRTCISRPRNSQ